MIERELVQELIEAYRRRLHKLELRVAQEGRDARPEDLNEIEDIRKKIAGLEQQRQELEAGRISLSEPEVRRLAEDKAAIESKLAQDERPPHIPFTNREDDLDMILASNAPPYYLLDAPAGYGKTELLRELKDRFRGKEKGNWLCAYVRAGKDSTLLDIARGLAQELELTFSPSSGRSPRQLGQDWAGAFKVQKGKAIAQPASGLVLLIDLDRKPSFDLLARLVQEFIPGVEDSLRGLKILSTQPNWFRVVLAGRYLASRDEILHSSLPFKVRQLTPFDYDTVRETIRRYLPDYQPDWLDQLAAHLTHFTAGHPGCIAKVLQLYGERGYPPPDGFFAEYGSRIWQEFVKPTVEEIRNDIPRRLRQILDTLSVFRYVDYPILCQLISGDKPVISGYNDEIKLADDLTGTHLLSWKGQGRVLRDDITRRLLAIRLSRGGYGRWRGRCRMAQEICAQRLREPTTKVPELFAMEYLYQSLQQHVKDIDSAEKQAEIRRQFFDEDVPEALQLLTGSGRGTREEWQALKEALAARESWDFRFAVNYFLRQEQYTDGPFQDLLHSIYQHFSGAR